MKVTRILPGSPEDLQFKSALELLTQGGATAFYSHEPVSSSNRKSDEPKTPPQASEPPIKPK